MDVLSKSKQFIFSHFKDANYVAISDKQRQNAESYGLKDVYKRQEWKIANSNLSLKSAKRKTVFTTKKLKVLSPISPSRDKKNNIA